MQTSRSHKKSPAVIEDTAFSTHQAWVRARAERLWNAIVPKSAMHVTQTPDGTAFRYLHPTKGWRFVSRKRLGLAPRATL